MAHGRQDFGEFAPVETVQPVLDLSELAARLGSADTYQRGGNVVLLDDLRGGLAGWEESTQGTESDVGLTTVYARTGIVSAYLRAGPDVDDFAQIQRYVSYLSPSILGLEVCHTGIDPSCNVPWGLNVYDGTDLIMPWVSYNAADNRFYLRNSSNAWEAFTESVELGSSKSTFHSMKLFADLTVPRYEKFLIGSASYDLSGFACYKVANSYVPSVQILFKIERGSAVSWRDILLDHLILTQNEV